jgi:prepilin-type N-terminal cleavage/methylation domain-containing protein
MRAVAVRERFLKEERGFTLVELMITTIIMMIVFFALYSIFDMSVRIFSVGNNKVEAMESAREGMEKMEREIRAAYPVDAGNSKTYLFFDANGSTSDPPKAVALSDEQITFGNELGAEGAGDGKITCNPPSTPCEYITYKLTDDASNTACTTAPCSLRRVNRATSTNWGDPLGENVFTPGGLTFTYLQSNGAPATSEDNIAKVRVRLRITVKPGTKYAASQILTTDIDLRNR